MGIPANQNVPVVLNASFGEKRKCRFDWQPAILQKCSGDCEIVIVSVVYQIIRDMIDHGFKVHARNRTSIFRLLIAAQLLALNGYLSQFLLRCIFSVNNSDEKHRRQKCGESTAQLALWCGFSRKSRNRATKLIRSPPSAPLSREHAARFAAVSFLDQNL